MNLKSFINLIQREAGSALTRQEILEISNWVQNEILTRSNELMRVRPDPFFATTDDTYSYAASSQIYDSSDGTQGTTQYDIREVKTIYSYDNSASIFDQQTLDPASDKPNQLTYTPTTDRVDLRFECIPSIKADNTDCTIKIWEGNDPGDTTIVWRAKCYKWPTQLTSENIAISIPEEFQDTLLLYGVMLRIRRREYGHVAVTDVQSWYDKYLKQFYDRYSRLATQDIKVCYPRDF